MILNINIKADVENISLSGLYELLNWHQINKKPDVSVYQYMGLLFEIEVELGLSIDYTITEIKL